MATRGRRRDFRRRYEPPTDVVTLGTKELNLSEKKLVIEMNSNSLGQFVKIKEFTLEGFRRGHIIMSTEFCPDFRTKLNEFVAEYERLPALPDDTNTTDSERLKTATLSCKSSRRRYFVDLRQNQRGRYLKVTMSSSMKVFIAVPGESLIEFRDAFIQLLDKFPCVDSVLDSDCVTVDSKAFHFDVEKNERGVFIKMTEKHASGYKVHVNIPHSSWTKIGDMFHTFAKKMPCPEQSTATCSDDN